ncbi:ABC-type polysaccharide/polyol phosphate transport system ATPase subunit [Canibacter oris]|uniref:ABC-type polysaccharide/polyol phosphate transport system ATPase subunit n=1 Tax=Canibacter oris TaxID=1365628 RepID=A0A840DI87_9MICO|nr:ABC-type polysaccharide/polyol phosphate transport system ATPase subunit [Canibacter oris]
MHSDSNSNIENPLELPKPGFDPRPAIIVNEVTKSFDIKHTHSLKETVIAAFRRKELSTRFHALNNVSFQVPQGQTLAMLGRNGSGKSTTLKLLSGVMRPDSGWIRTRGRVAGLLEVGAGFHPDLTGRANVYLNAAILGMSKEEVDERFDSILEFSEIGEFIDTEVKFYSSGMYSRLGFAVAIHTEMDILLVDEILSVGDAQFREKCHNKIFELQEQGKTMFIVSHAADQVKMLCERGIVLDHGKVAFDGPIDEAVEHLNAPR